MNASVNRVLIVLAGGPSVAQGVGQAVSWLWPNSTVLQLCWLALGAASVIVLTGVLLHRGTAGAPERAGPARR